MDGGGEKGGMGGGGFDGKDENGGKLYVTRVPASHVMSCHTSHHITS